MRKFKMVIVENDEDEQLFMFEGFTSSGLFDIIAQLNSGDELFEWLKQKDLILPDFILSDLNMPGKNGYDILDYIKNHPDYLRLPIIITSTSSTPSTVEKCLRMGASDYIVKPETFVAYQDYAKILYETIEQKQLVK